MQFFGQIHDFKEAIDARFSSQNESIEVCIAPTDLANASMLLALASTSELDAECEVVFLNILSLASLESLCDEVK